LITPSSDAPIFNPTSASQAGLVPAVFNAASCNCTLKSVVESSISVSVVGSVPNMKLTSYSGIVLVDISMQRFSSSPVFL